MVQKARPRVFLGVIAVAERTDIMHDFEASTGIEGEDLLRSLNEIFSLPLARNAEAPLPTDLVLDVMVPRFRVGGLLEIDLGGIGGPVFWRPKITVTSRLYSLTTNQTKAVFHVTEKMGWARFVGRCLSVCFLLRQQLADSTDLEQLLCTACVKSLHKIQRAV